jgi:hypothetical protein
MLNLHTKILQTIPGDTIQTAARLLGLFQGNTIVFDDEDQTGVLMDLAIYEPVRGEVSVLDTYIATHSYESEETALLDAMADSKTSLFEIMETRPDRHQLIYQDLLNPAMGKITLTDVHLSQTAEPGVVIFSRIMDVAGFTMSSGIGFPFKADLKKYLIQRHKTVMKKIPAESAAVRKHVAFFKLHRSEGLVAVFEKLGDTSTSD